VVRGLGGERVHIVATLRPLAKILPSHWQQAVRNGMRTTYRQWLKTALTDPIDASSAGAFWRRHAHDRLVDRWVAAAGADKVVVVVADDTNRRAVFEAFEKLLDIPEGQLAPPQGEIVNRSLTYPEIELIRRINQHFHRREWPPRLYRAAVRFGAVPELRDRDPGDQPPIWTPEWALARAAAIGAEAAERIRASGVHVMGDLDTLGWRPPQGSIRRPPDNKDLRIPVEAAALAVMGAIAGAERVTTNDAARAQAAIPPPPIVRVRKGVRRRLRKVKNQVTAGAGSPPEHTQQGT
jgi:hypothetical protein